MTNWSSRCKKGHRIPKKLPYGATRGRYWCNRCDRELISSWYDKPIKKTERKKAKDEILKEFDIYEKNNKAKATDTKALFKKVRNEKYK